MPFKMTRNEHLEEAEKLLEHADRYWEGTDGSDDWMMRSSLLIQMANTHTAIAAAMPVTVDDEYEEDLSP